MEVSKRAEKNEKVIVNRDFSMIVPEGYLFSIDKSVINENRLFVFMKDEKNNTFIENLGDDAEFNLTEPFSAPQYLAVFSAQSLGGAIDLSNKEARDSIISFLAAMLSQFGEDVITVKTTDDILVSYAKKNDPTIVFAVATSCNVYVGQICINDINDVVKRNDLIETWLNTAANYVLTDADKVPRTKFDAPTYLKKKREQVRNITLAIPDNMTTLLDSADNRRNLGNVFDLSNMMNEFAFVAISNECKGGFHDYEEAKMSIIIRNSEIQYVPSIAEFWKPGKADEREEVFKASIAGNFSDPAAAIHYMELGKNTAAVYGQVSESTDNIEQWARYFILINNNTTLMSTHIYINALLDKKAMDKAIEDWVKRIESV